MGIRAYKRGLKARLSNEKFLEHRKGRPYDRQTDNDSYTNGYYKKKEDNEDSKITKAT